MTETFDLKKVCDVCKKPIGDSYGNLLCDEHYKKQTEENEQKKKDEVEDKKMDNQDPPALAEKVREMKEYKEEEIYDTNKVTISRLYREKRKTEEPRLLGDPGSQDPDKSIKDPKYRENPEAPDKDQVVANMAQFINGNILLYHHQHSMYTYVKDYMAQQAQSHAQFSKHIWKPKVVDVGCGAGIGTNILSWEADYAWGIDKNEMSISFAKQAFTREKNGIYYNAQEIFDLIDITTTEFEFDKFDVVVAIEIIEHVNDWRLFLKSIITNFTKKNKQGGYEISEHSGPNGKHYVGTTFFISTPNRNNSKISNERPKNVFHVREWTSQEFKASMEEYFEEVVLYAWTGARVEDDTTHTPLFAKCRKPK